MRKIGWVLCLLGILLGTIALADAEAEGQQLDGSCINITLPEGYFLVNANTISSLREDEKLWDGILNHSPDIADETYGGWPQYVVNRDGRVCMEIRTDVYGTYADLDQFYSHAEWLMVKEGYRCETELAQIEVGNRIFDVASSRHEPGREDDSESYRECYNTIDSMSHCVTIYARFDKDFDKYAAYEILGGFEDPWALEVNRDSNVWEAWTLDYMINTDGERCELEECGNPSVNLYLNSNGTGVVMMGESATCFDYTEKRYDSDDNPETLYLRDVNVRKDGEDGLYCNAYWSSDLQHFVRTRASFDTEKLVGEWIYPDESGLFSYFDDELRICFRPNGICEMQSRLMDSLQPFGGEAKQVKWMVLDDRLYFLHEDHNVVRIDYALSDDSFLSYEESPCDWVEQDVIKAPLHYDSPKQVARWAGTWGGESRDGNQAQAYFCRINPDGTMECCRTPGFHMPDTVLDSIQMYWKPAENGIEIWEEGGQPRYIPCSKGDLVLDVWSDAGEALSLGRIDSYQARLDSLPKGLGMSEIIGVWYAQPAVIGQDLMETQIILDHNGNFSSITITTPDQDPRRASQSRASGTWRFAEDGQTLLVQRESEETSIMRWDGETVFILPDGATPQPAIRQADAAAWDGRAFPVLEIFNYMDTGLVGVWQGEGKSLETHESEGKATVYLDAKGKAKVVSDSGSVVLGSWRFSEGSAVLQMEQDLPHMLDANTANAMYPDKWLDEPCMGLRYYEVEWRLTKVEDYWEADFENADEADFVVKDGVLTRYLGDDASVVIPDDLNIASIDEGVFRNNRMITSVTIPEGVTSIGREAFAQCTALVSATMPSTLTVIGEGAFRECESLASVVLPEGLLSIGGSAFYGCEVLAEVPLPSTLVFLGESAFSQCAQLKAAVIPGGVSMVPESAFNGCAALESVKFCAGVASIQRYAFAWCHALYTVEIPATVTEIDPIAFKDCENLTAFVEDGSYAQTFCQEEGVDWEIAQMTQEPLAVEDGQPIFIVEGNVLVACKNACGTLVIPDNLGIEEIGEKTFLGNADIESVTLPQGVKTIGFRAFNECENLRSVILPEGLETIGGNAFDGCVSLEECAIPDTVTEIYSAAFFGCVKLREAVIPVGVTVIDHMVFYGCEQLESLSLSENLKSIYQDAFAFCASLRDVKLPDGLRSIGQAAFSGCAALENVELPETLETIGYGAFQSCSRLKSIVIPASVETLEGPVFWHCTGLESVLILSETVGVEEDFLGGCPQGVVCAKEGSRAQSDCETWGIPFEILDNSELPGYASQAAILSDETPVDDFLYEQQDDGTICLTKYIGDAVDVRLPEQINGMNVTTIGSDAFSENETLERVVVSEHVVTLGSKAFFGCDRLNSVVLPEGMSTFGKFVFGNCPDLKLRVVAGSKAETYAREKNLNYTVLGTDERS